MESTEGYSLRLTRHASEQMEAKGFDLDSVTYTFENPKSVYPNKKFAGQFRVTGSGICLIGKPLGNDFLVFTIYEDGVMTPPRPDQLDTPEGKKYAALYEKAVATGRVKRNGEYWPRVHQRKKSDMRHKLIK